MPSKPSREQLSLAFAMLSDDTLGADSFRGLASVFGVLIDTWIPTRILPGAFTKTLQENAKRVKVLYQHNTDWPIGIPTRMEENSVGLLVEAKVSQTVMGQEALMLIRDGVLTELSIGFDPIKFIHVEEDLDGLKVIVRHITECRLWEFSPVTFAANAKSSISSVNSLFNATRIGEDIELHAETHALIKRVLHALCSQQLLEPIDFYVIVTQAITELHAGKVLSAKNLVLVNSAIDALTKLRDAAEPVKDDESKPLTDVEGRIRSLNLSYFDALRVTH